MRALRCNEEIALFALALRRWKESCATETQRRMWARPKNGVLVVCDCTCARLRRLFVHFTDTHTHVFHFGFDKDTQSLSHCINMRRAYAEKPRCGSSILCAKYVLVRTVNFYQNLGEMYHSNFPVTRLLKPCHTSIYLDNNAQT